MMEHHYPVVRPAADIMDDDGGVRVLANMPGVREDDLHLLMNGNALRIQANSHCPRPETGGRNIRNLEFGNVEFALEIAMDAPLSAPPTATLQHGVLSLFLPGEDRKSIRVR
ncbi:MAG: Hsp20/alpha crystallin family protein [Mailhella sp.]|nr:Hsp20/alpha crystallin family protein [Mailhella sp.]